MIDYFINILRTLIENYGVWGVFLAAFTEEVIAPIPSGIVMMSAGYGFLIGLPVNIGNLLYLGYKVALPLSLGLTLGSFFVYGIAYRYGETLIKKFGKYIGLSWSDIERVRRQFEKGYQDELILLFIRSLPLLPSVAINAVCGIMRFKIKTYALMTFLGSFIRAYIISFAGWQLGNVYELYAPLVDRSEKYVLASLLGLFIAYLLWKKYKK